jgi:hypothetical protein
VNWKDKAWLVSGGVLLGLWLVANFVACGKCSHKIGTHRPVDRTCEACEKNDGACKRREVARPNAERESGEGGRG